MASIEITEAATMEDMELETLKPSSNTDVATKREREDEATADENGAVSKKQKLDDEKSVEETRMEKLQENSGEVEEEKKEEKIVDPVKIGPKTFGSSLEMFNYFYKLLHSWPLFLDLNKYEHMVLLELIKKGHPEADKKIGSGVEAFEVREHSVYKSRCFFAVRTDKSAEDFSFRKCVNNILPLPENMQGNSDVNNVLGGGRKKGGGGGGGRGGGRGRGRGRGRGGNRR
ncbi:hypothetical protein BVRB_5g114730 [Beta vulgaris subsp. vulgaris]|uniref:protein EMBRYO DEFECTIVE 514 n=1 Tax=Beta vulgaris subsp. vulgaris TaxID=3555 RepID=UPI000540327C|nr:protein EMBRYO DEFECTIVE 514 [Beta vulgaris subsp. vulgaris]KMT10819.1 hypothetical protein BVRB_5g114730 [Beta vulgaris subsp. vulgaris]